MLSRLFRKRQPAVEFDPPAPEAVLEVVGDIHGCAHLLSKLPPVEAGAIRVLVGDYVDRGPDSRGTLEFLHQRAVQDGWICLRGNHEEMFLEFLREPGKARRWLHHGGLQTLASFGVGGITETAGEAELNRAAEIVAQAMSPELRDWLETLPVHWSSGTVSVVHAALDPGLPITLQSEESMLWGHSEFAVLARRDRQWVAHGHSIVDLPSIRNGVISVDTGAYATGRLTLARIDRSGDVSFEFVTS